MNLGGGTCEPLCAPLGLLKAVLTLYTHLQDLIVQPTATCRSTRCPLTIFGADRPIFLSLCTYHQRSRRAYFDPNHHTSHYTNLRHHPA